MASSKEIAADSIRCVSPIHVTTRRRRAITECGSLAHRIKLSYSAAPFSRQTGPRGRQMREPGASFRERFERARVSRQVGGVNFNAMQIGASLGLGRQPLARAGNVADVGHLIKQPR